MHEERRALAFLFKGIGAEIGTERGVYAKMIMVRGKPDLLYCPGRRMSDSAGSGSRQPGFSFCPTPRNSRWQSP